VLGTVFFVALGQGSGVAAYASALRWEIAFSLTLCLVSAVVAWALPRPPKAAPAVAPAAAATGPVKAAVDAR
jgi:hypothetical protein